MEQRAHALAEAAIDSAEPWVRDLGPRPDDPEQEGRWLGAVAAAAVHRERMSAGGDAPPSTAATTPSLDPAWRLPSARPQPPTLGDPPDASEAPTAQPVTI